MMGSKTLFELLLLWNLGRVFSMDMNVRGLRSSLREILKRRLLGGVFRTTEVMSKRNEGNFGIILNVNPRRVLTSVPFREVLKDFRRILLIGGTGKGNQDSSSPARWVSLVMTQPENAFAFA